MSDIIQERWKLWIKPDLLLGKYPTKSEAIKAKKFLHELGLGETKIVRVVTRRAGSYDKNACSIAMANQAMRAGLAECDRLRDLLWLARHTFANLGRVDLALEFNP